MIYGKKDELVPVEYINELNKRLSSQKGIKVEFESIPESNHFFSKNEGPLVKSLNKYIKKETALY
jgi:alpha/beta superfamily hydrolase